MPQFSFLPWIFINLWFFIFIKLFLSFQFLFLTKYFFTFFFFHSCHVPLIEDTRVSWGKGALLSAQKSLNSHPIYLCFYLKLPHCLISDVGYKKGKIISPLPFWVHSWDPCDRRQVNRRKTSLLRRIPNLYMGNTQGKMTNFLGGTNSVFSTTCIERLERRRLHGGAGV